MMQAILILALSGPAYSECWRAPYPGYPRDATGERAILAASAPAVIVSDGVYNAFPGLTVLEDGTLLVVYRKGTAHVGDKGIIVKRASSDRGATWSPETIVYSDSALDARDPSIVRLGNGGLIVSFFVYDHVATRLQRDVYTVVSTDGGATWGAKANASGFSGYNACSAPVLETADGKLLLPVYGGDRTTDLASSRLMQSTDGGLSWRLLSTIQSARGTARYAEPNVIRLSNGNLMAALRNDADGHIYTATSADDGASWGPAVARFVGWGSPRLSQYASGAILVTSRSGTYTRRNPLDGRLTVRVSADGVAWSDEFFPDRDEILWAGEYASPVPLLPGVMAMAYCVGNDGAQTDCRLTLLRECSALRRPHDR